MLDTLLCGAVLSLWGCTKGYTRMFFNDQGLPSVSETASASDNVTQWEEYLHEQYLWDHFLSFTPEAIQWTYNVQ